jgi:hypothetical protein
MATAQNWKNGTQISIRHPEADMDLPALRVRPHGSRSPAPGLEQISMQKLWQAISLNELRRRDAAEVRTTQRGNAALLM